MIRKQVPLKTKLPKVRVPEEHLHPYSKSGNVETKALSPQQKVAILLKNKKEGL